MTKLFAIAFTCVYLTLTVGVVRTTHYCMGRVKSSTLFSFDSTKCACAKFALPAYGTCCDDEHTLIAIEDDHAAAPALSISPEFFAISDLTFLVPLVDNRVTEYASFIDKDPPGQEVPLFVKHCSLILFDEESIA